MYPVAMTIINSLREICKLQICTRNMLPQMLLPAELQSIFIFSHNVFKSCRFLRRRILLFWSQAFSSFPAMFSKAISLSLLVTSIFFFSPQYFKKPPIFQLFPRRQSFDLTQLESICRQHFKCVSNNEI